MSALKTRELPDRPPIRVLIAKPGLDGHDRGAKVMARAMRDAGFEVIYQAYFSRLKMIATAALQEDVDVIGLSILSGAHLAVFPLVMQELHDRGLDDVLVVAGGTIPEDDLPVVRSLGISEVLLDRACQWPQRSTTSGKTHPTAVMIEGLVADALDGNPPAIARLATLIENRGEQADEIVQAIYPSTGNAHVIGITGPPGAGKSSLIDKLVAAYRAEEHRVAVVAVDPSSVRTGGAALGDRVRMNSAYGDEGVFVRSMASRGQTDGLALGTAGIVHLLDATGFDVVLVETVGVGQEQIDVTGIAHTIVLLQVPGSGDAVQFLKAGILEFADVIVVNKPDLPGAAELRKDLRAAISEASQLGIDWSPQIVTTSATQDQGVPELVSAIDAHAAHMKSSGEFERRSRAIAEREVLLSMREQMQRKILAGTQPQQAELVEDVANRKLSPAAAARQLMETQPGS